MTQSNGISRRSFLKAVAGSTAAAIAASATPFTALARQEMMYSEAPMLADMVAAGELPPVEDRLPANPRVVPVRDEIGQYGGTWRRAYKGISDMQGPVKIVYAFGLHFNISQDLETIEIVEGLYDEWTQNDDATEFTFHIREGMRWSDGELFDTEDVQFWYDWYYQTDLGPSYSVLEVGGQPMELEVVDQYTFTVRFGASNPLLPFRIARDDTEGQHGGPTMAAAAHFLGQYIPEIGDQDLIDAAIAEHEVGSWEELFGGGDLRGPVNWWARNPDAPVMGAWYMESPPPFNEPIVMVRNPYFYCVDEEGHQLPYIDRIQHTLFEDNAVFDLMIAQGNIDMHERHVGAANYTYYKENESEGDYTVYLWKSASTNAYYPNTSSDDPKLREIFSNPKFREALSIAINRSEINELIYDGLYETRQASPVTGSPEFDPEFEQRWTEYDPERAMALLDEIGLEADGDGNRDVTFTLTHSQTGQSILDEINLVVSYWRAIGLDVILAPVERSLYEEYTESNAIDMGYWGFDRSLLLEADPRSYIGDSGQQTYVTKYNWWRRGEERGEAPPEDHPIREIWALWDQASTEPDPDKRHELMMQLVGVHKNAPFAIGTVGEPVAPVIVTNRMKNVPNNIVSDTSLRNVRVANPEQFFFKE